MKLIFDDEIVANNALNIVNSNYGCPISLPNGYIMTEWAQLSKKYNANFWEFTKPTEDKLTGVSGWVQEVDRLPYDWYEPEE